MDNDTPKWRATYYNYLISVRCKIDPSTTRQIEAKKQLDQIDVLRKTYINDLGMGFLSYLKHHYAMDCEGFIHADQLRR